MPSGSSLIGDARDRTAAFVAGPRKAAPSLHVQTTQGDAFADVFRLMANTSPAARESASRSSQLRADAAKDDTSNDAEKASQPASDDRRATRQAKDNDPQAELLGLTPLAPAAEQIGVTEGEAKPLATDAGDELSKDASDHEADMVAAVQHQTIVTPGSPEGEPMVAEATSGGEDMAPEQARAEIEPQDQTPPVVDLDVHAETGDEAPGERMPKAIPTTAVHSSDDTSGDPALPNQTAKIVVSDGSGPVEAPADGQENAAGEEIGKPIFGGRDEEGSDSRRRHGKDARMPAPTLDANRVPVEPSPAETAKMQGDVVSRSMEIGVDAATSNPAVREAIQSFDTLQASSNSVSQPVVSVAAAYHASTSDAAPPKAPGTTTPQVGVGSTQPGATESTQRPAPKDTSGPGIADRIRLVQRVSNAFQRLGVDGGQVRIRLHPAELGSVRLDLQIQGKRLNARVTTETEAARGVLREHLSDLRQRLGEQGIQVERIDVELETEGEGNHQSPQQDDSGDRFGQPQRRDRRAASLLPGQVQNGSPRSDEIQLNSQERSVADAASRPGVDLVF